MDKASDIKFTPKKDDVVTKEQMKKLGRITRLDIEMAKAMATGLLGDLIKLRILPDRKDRLR